jgi:hypothetical protein
MISYLWLPPPLVDDSTLNRELLLLLEVLELSLTTLIFLRRMLPWELAGLALSLIT